MSESRAPIHTIEVQTIDGESYSLDRYAGQVMLVVNTASKCGFTPQFDGLEKLHADYADKGVAVLGFPCNQFGRQDPGSNDEIAGFCRLNYGVSFPMHAKVEVNGGGTHPLFAHLKGEAKGVLGTTPIKWNFTKFLVDQDGRVLERFAPTVTPDKIRPKLDALLAGGAA